MKYDDGVTPPDDYVEMHTGRKFWLNNPIYDPHEIAHSLAFNCRYTGHCKRFYSVGEHSILVADIMRHFNMGRPFEGLMHDGVESVLADINSPVKYGMLPQYCTVENFFDVALRKQFNLPLAKTIECKKADFIALAIEAKMLMSSGGKNWSMPDYARPMADQYLAAHNVQLGFEPFDHVRTTWLSLFNLLYTNRSFNHEPHVAD